MPDDHRGITVADIKGLLVWTPVVLGIGYGIAMWTQTQNDLAYAQARIAALESLVSVEAIKKHAVWSANVERDIRELRSGQGALICAPNGDYLVCMPKGVRP